MTTKEIPTTRGVDSSPFPERPDGPDLLREMESTKMKRLLMLAAALLLVATVTASADEEIEICGAYRGCAQTCWQNLQLCMHQSFVDLDLCNVQAEYCASLCPDQWCGYFVN